MLMNWVQEQLRTKPILWAGVAAGAGFAIGMAGSLIRRRRRPLPTLLILESC